MKTYTGIGSRETPKDILKLMTDIAFKLAQKGFILRSGSAGGADTAFEEGAKAYAEQIDERVTLAQLYIPWASFVKYDDYYKDWYKVLDRMPKKVEAYQLASEIHPAWDRCSTGAKALHARNTFQVLGSNLSTPSNFLICWAKVDKHGNISGGTKTAWELAKKYDIPCFNLHNEEDKQRLIKFVES
jgi:hypothetical protein